MGLNDVVLEMMHLANSWVLRASDVARWTDPLVLNPYILGAAIVVV